MSKQKNPPAPSQSPKVAELANPPVEIPQLTPLEMIQIQLSPNQVSEDQGNRISAITKSSIDFAASILANTKRSADQTAALRKIREAKMTAVAAIATEEFL